MPDAFTPASALGAGVVAGLSVAVPLGAVGVLLLQEGMRRGWRGGAGAAAGVATVDLVYAGLAAGAGAVVSSLLDGRERAVRLVAGAVLAAVAMHGLWALTRGRRADEPRPDDVPPASDERSPSGSASGSVVAVRPGAVRGWVRFVGITAVNPATCLYFLAVAAGLGGRLDGAASRTAFTAGVGAGSLAWQLVLVGIGAGAGRVLGERGRTVTAVAGNLVVLALAVAVLVG